MPDLLFVDTGYTLRVTALDPATGNAVAGVKVGLMIVTGTTEIAPGSGEMAATDWYLVPGPNA